MRRLASAVAVALLTAGCGGAEIHADSGSGGTLTVLKDGKYAYDLQVACLSPEPLTPFKATATFQLAGPGHAFVYLSDLVGASLMLTSGSWTGAPGYRPPVQGNIERGSFQPQPFCAWSLTLTPSN